MELMIVVAIISVLAAIVYPAYGRYVDRSNRAAAQQFMLDIASRAEEYRLDRNQYPADLATVGKTVPADIAEHFTITLAGDNSAPPSYTVTATPTTAVAGRQPTMTLLSDGTRTPADQW